MAVYVGSGINDHYMYANQGMKTLCCGIGMGGQRDYFALWIDANFGFGHSKARPRNTTFDCPRLSHDEEFSFTALEVWAVGPAVDGSAGAASAGTATVSVLDRDPTAVALLEMAGRTMHSRGVRSHRPGERERAAPEGGGIV